MQQRQEIPDEEHEQLLERVAAIDVAKATGMVCTRVPHPTVAKRITTVWEVAATTRSILGLADDLLALGVQKVTLEATSDYWRGFYYLLEAQGLDVQLVNAREVKNVPGRPKTDKLDAVWLAKLTERGMLRASFVPPPQIRVLRDYTRARSDLIGDRTRCWNRLEKLLEDALIKVTSVASSIDTVSVREMLEALIAGQRDPRVLAGLARGRMRIKYTALVEALTGRFDEHHGELARLLLDQIDVLNTQIEALSTRIEQLLATISAACAPAGPHDPNPPPQQGPTPEQAVLAAVDRLDEIPGLGRDGAQIILAEIGLDMTRFPTPENLVSWARLCPQTVQSGPKTRKGKTPKGNRYLKGVLGEAAAAAARTDTFLGARYRRLLKRNKSKLKALVAVARSILVIIWHLLNEPTARYRDLGADYHTCRIDKQRKTRDHVRQLEALGYTVTLTAPAA